MKKKKISKSSKRRLLFLGSFSVFAIVYCFVTISTYVINIYNLRSDQRKLSNQLSELKEEQQNLENQITMLQDQEYLARYARENYYYSKDGELVIKINKKSENEEKTKYFKIDNKIFIAIGGILCLVILIYIIKSK